MTMTAMTAIKPNILNDIPARIEVSDLDNNHVSKRNGELSKRIKNLRMRLRKDRLSSSEMAALAILEVKRPEVYAFIAGTDKFIGPETSATRGRRILYWNFISCTQLIRAEWEAWRKSLFSDEIFFDILVYLNAERKIAEQDFDVICAEIPFSGYSNAAARRQITHLLKAVEKVSRC